MPSIFLARVWKKLNLIARLMVVSSLLFMIGGTLLLNFLFKQIADNRRTTLTETLQAEIQTLVPMIGEYAVIGDYASIQQVLNTRVQRTDMQHIEWQDAKGTIIHVENTANSLQAPAWFTRWIGLSVLTAVDVVEVGGSGYGSVLLQLSPIPSENFLWRTLQQQVLITLLSVAIFYSVMILFFWRQLRPLQALVKGTKKFGEGDYTVRIEPASAPEISASISAFNHMADTIQKLLASTLEKEAHLRAVMNSVDDAIIILDERHVIESFNHATARIFACSPAQLSGRPLLSLLEGAWVEKSSIPSTTAPGLETETNGRRGDGTLFPIEFSVKPVQAQGRQLFMANIRDISKRRHTEALLAQDRERLENYQASTEQELKLAHHVFQTITSENARKPAPLELWTRPMGLFNGDLLLYEYSPSGNLHIMLCDFTGHGLGAAIGAIPVSDAFLSMSKKGYGIHEIAAEINSKLKRMLPTGHFCAACLMSINQEAQGMEIWNGGLPPVLILGEDRKIMRRVASSKLPLGIAAAGEFDGQTEMLSLQGVHSAFIYSDGLTEARNHQDDMLGQAMFEEMIETTPNAGSWLDNVKWKITGFVGDCALSDDLSLLYVQCNTPYVVPSSMIKPKPSKRVTGEALPGSWHIELQLNGDMIKKGAPLPLLMNWLIGLSFPELQRGHVYTILSELINNAVDHGLLQLESTLKNTPAGFENYYATRQKLFDELNQGMLTVRLSQKRQAEGKNAIHILVKDSGSGFDPKQIFSQLDENDKNFGRGISLVHSLCSKLSYQGCGNEASAVYVFD